MASLEHRGNGFRIIFRMGGRKYHVGVTATNRRDADACRIRLEENLRLGERGRLAIPDGADVGLFLLTDGRLEQKVKVERPVRLGEMFDLYRREFTAGAKAAITREMEMSSSSTRPAPPAGRRRSPPAPSSVDGRPKQGATRRSPN